MACHAKWSINIDGDPAALHNLFFILKVFSLSGSLREVVGSFRVWENVSYWKVATGLESKVVIWLEFLILKVPPLS